MGFLGGLLNTLVEAGQKFDEKSKEYYERYKHLRPEKILVEMDNSGTDMTKRSALQKLYNEKTSNMSSYELEKITKEAKSHCTAATYNYALQVYQKETNRRDPWT